MKKPTKGDAESRRIKAWIQMGTERRETVIEVPHEEFDSVVEKANGDLEISMEGYVQDWIPTQYGWGWSGCGIENDFSFMEGSNSSSFAVTRTSSIPNTVHRRVRPRSERKPATEG